MAPQRSSFGSVKLLRGAAPARGWWKELPSLPCPRSGSARLGRRRRREGQGRHLCPVTVPPWVSQAPWLPPYPVPQFPSSARQSGGGPLPLAAAAVGGACVTLLGALSPSLAPQLLLLPPWKECCLHLPHRQQLLCIQAPPAVPRQPPPVPFGEGRSSCPPRHPGDVGDGVPGDTASCSPRGKGSWLERVCLPPPPGTGSGQAPAACGVGDRRRQWWRVCGAAAGGSGSCAGGSRSCPQMSPCPQGAAELNAARAAAPASPHAGQTRAASLLGAA